MKTIPHISFPGALRRFAPIILLAAVVCALYGNSLQNEFIWDDKPLIVEDSFIRSLSNIPFFFGLDYWTNHRPIDLPGEFRPVRATSFALDYSLWGLNPFGYHLTNMLIHLANTLLLFIILTMSMRRFPRLADAGGNGSFARRFIPLAAALLFASHPALTESVTWVKNRSELLALFFSLLTFYLLLSVKDARPRFPRALFLFFSLVTYVLAFFSKETAIVLPALILLFFMVADGRIGRKTIIAIAPFFLVALFFIWFKLFFLDTMSYRQEFQPPSIMDHVRLVCGTMGLYFKILIFPVDLSIDRSSILYNPSIASETLPFTVMLIALFLFALYCRRWGIILFACAWLAITILPAANILIIWARPVAEQRLYFPAAGYCLFVASTIAVFAGTLNSTDLLKRTAPVFAVVLVAVLVAVHGHLVISRNREWRDEYTIWQNAFDRNPENRQAVQIMIAEIEKWPSASKRVLALRRIMDIRPGLAAVMFKLANEYLALGKFPEAMSLYRQILRTAPDHADAWNNLGALHQRMNQTSEAVRCFEKALAADPYLAAPYQNLSMIYFEQGLYRQAVEHVDSAIEKGLHIDRDYLSRLAPHRQAPFPENADGK